MNRKRIHSKDSSNRNNAWARPHCCAHANLVAGVVFLWTCLPLGGAPRPGGAIGFKGLLLGEHRDTVVPKLTGLGCRLPEKHKSNLSVHADCDANPVESIALYFHPKTLKLYQIYATLNVIQQRRGWMASESR